MHTSPIFPTRLWAFIAIGYLTFAIYGSLVPLHFRALPWDQAVAQFSNIPYLSLGIASRADWVANILLFIPLAFLWNGLLAPRDHSAVAGGGRLRGVAVSLLIVALCVALSIAIEFTQTFFPPRTVSLNDILAESIGAMIGVMLWWMLGARFVRWLAGWSNAHQGWPGRLLYLYLFGLAVYSVLPLDLTISPVELFHKWREGRVMLIPFGFHFTHPAQALYALLSDMAIWAPAGVLYRLHRSTDKVAVQWLALIAAAVVVEGLQLFVYSRVSDITDIITAGLGAGLGLWGARFVANMETGMEAKGSGGMYGLPHPTLWLALGWCGVLMTVFWFPFDFRTDGSFVRERLALLGKVPFETYYYGTEFRAITEVLHKILFFMPLGAFMALAARSLRHHMMSVVMRILTPVVLPGMPAVIELGQTMLPGKYPDTTDWLLETFGALLGYTLIVWQKRGSPGYAKPVRPIVPAATPAPAFTRSPAPTHPHRGMHWKPHAMVYGVLLAGIWLVTHSPAAPYNVRELLGEYPLWSAVLLAGLLYWTFGAPVWIAMRSDAAGLRGWNMLPLLFVHAVFAWVLLRSAVPMESIHDIVGSPVLGWPWEWEIMGRFLALFGIATLLLTGAAVIILRLCGARTGKALLYWCYITLLLLPALLWVVVGAAATDNLTELMRDGGSVTACVWLVIFWLMIAFTGSLTSRALARRSPSPWPWRWAAMLAVAASLPLGYAVFTAATEPLVIKYDQVFSAMQFLFSPDRGHYASGAGLLIRYGIFQSGLIALIVLTQYPLWRQVTDTAPKTAPRKKARSTQPSPPAP